MNSTTKSMFRFIAFITCIVSSVIFITTLFLIGVDFFTLDEATNILFYTFITSIITFLYFELTIRKKAKNDWK